MNEQPSSMKTQTAFFSLGDPPFGEKERDVACTELIRAGIPPECIVIHNAEYPVLDNTWPNCIIPQLHGRLPVTRKILYGVKATAYYWEFERLWSYWDCRCCDISHSIPYELAKKLNDALRDVVAIDGYAGGRNLELGDSVSMYHVRTPEGLKEFIKTLKHITIGKINGHK